MLPEDRVPTTTYGLERTAFNWRRGWCLRVLRTLVIQSNRSKIATREGWVAPN